eukprot:TRINITY_DN14050_c2_g1_i2.p3 TRINITY_DN14050_c2_g1~~TRINITY_DN14050_c2_g1_i2.p3  ORF type:complete len:148 (-),score=10.17 TRINITY_DN14050_c2_g1_i2:125-568(-)
MEDIDELLSPSQEQGNFSDDTPFNETDDYDQITNDTSSNETSSNDQFPKYDYTQTEEIEKPHSTQHAVYPTQAPETTESGGGTSTALLVVLIILVIVTISMLVYCYIRQVRRRGGTYRRNRSGPRWVGVGTQESELTSMRRRGAGVI